MSILKREEYLNLLKEDKQLRLIDVAGVVLKVSILEDDCTQISVDFIKMGSSYNIEAVSKWIERLEALKTFLWERDNLCNEDSVYDEEDSNE